MLLCWTEIKWSVNDSAWFFVSCILEQLTSWGLRWGCLLLIWSCFVPPHGSFPRRYCHWWTPPSLPPRHQPELPSLLGSAEQKQKQSLDVQRNKRYLDKKRWASLEEQLPDFLMKLMKMNSGNDYKTIIAIVYILRDCLKSCLCQRLMSDIKKKSEMFHLCYLVSAAAAVQSKLKEIQTHKVMFHWH